MTRTKLNSYSVEIDWKKVDHIRPKIEEKSISLEIKPTNNPLPRVMVFTIVNDPILLAFNVYSWKSVQYPRELLNWVIIDPKNSVTPESLGLEDDNRVRIIKPLKSLSFYNTIKKYLSSEWYFTTETDTEQRPLYYTTMDCGDVWFADTLSLKFRALTEGYDCVIPDTLACYNPLDNTSIAYKLFLKFPRSGLYFKGGWWEKQQSKKIIGIPYLGNCISIGKPSVDAMPQQASIRFFDNFPADVKIMLRQVLVFLMNRMDKLDE